MVLGGALSQPDRIPPASDCAVVIKLRDEPVVFRSPGLATGETRDCCRCTIGGGDSFRIAEGVGSKPDRISPKLAAPVRAGWAEKPSTAVDNDKGAGLFSPAYFCAMRAC
jgi:hypothetical protein